MYKAKCEDCKTWHGGFHLCLKDVSTDVTMKAPAPIFDKESDAYKNRLKRDAERRYEARNARMNRRDALNEFLIPKIAESYPTMGISDLAELYEISTRRVRDLLTICESRGLVTIRRRGETVPKTRRLHEDIRPELIERYKTENVTYKMLGDYYGLTVPQVQRIMDDAKRDGTIEDVRHYTPITKK